MITTKFKKGDSAILSAFGVFCDPHDGIVEQTFSKVRVAFPRSTILTGFPQQVFLSRASLQDISKLVIFSKDYQPGSAALCGLKISYNNNSHALLGEDSEKCQPFHLTDTIQSISVGYIQCYGTRMLVTGLVINTRYNEFALGHSDNSQTTDTLQINQVRSLLPLCALSIIILESSLYWAFNHLYTCIALSKEEATRAPISDERDSWL